MILFVSGATGGHIYPGVALAQTLNLPAHFVVSREYPAKSILAPYKLPFQVIGFSVKRVLLFPILASQILRVLLKKRPQMIIAMGGGICVPFAVMGWCFRIPVISFEQNAIPGRATRAIQFFCKKIITAFESAKNGLYAKSKVMCMGNPTRLHYPITDALPDEWDQIKGTTLLVVGGSQGALKINEFIYENRQAILMRGMNIIHLTGPAFLKGKASFVDSDNDHVYVAIPYLNNMNLAYQKASVVMCRSGATTLAELHYQHIPSILVPYPYAMDNHQEKNAIEFAKDHNNASILLETGLSMTSLSQLLNNVDEKKSVDFVADPSKDLNSICELIKTYLK